MGNLRWSSMAGFAAAVVATSATTATIALLRRYVEVPDVALLYLPVILAIGVYFGTWPSLTAAILAALQYDFFFLQPALTLTIAQAQDVVALSIFVLVAIITGQLAARARTRVEVARRQVVESTTLHELERALQSGDDVEDVLDAITRRIVDVFDVTLCAVFVPDGSGQLKLAAETYRGLARRDRASQAAAGWAFEHDTPVTVPGGPQHRIYIPLRTAEKVVGVMEIGPPRSGGALDSRDHRLLTSFAAQAALVILRAQGEEERRKLRLLEESDRVKSALLSAVSHDLRTPLASIKASATALLLADAAWTAEEGREMLEAIDHEVDRLNRLVGNLLDLTRIEAGALRPLLDRYDVAEMIDHALPRLTSLLEDRRIELAIEPNLPPVWIDMLRIEEMLINLVENAAKYAPPDSVITIEVGEDGDDLRIAVVDHGPGVPVAQRERIFDRFYRLQQHSDRDHGTGLGLAICRGIVEAHGGTIAVDETPGGGATFAARIPLARRLEGAAP